MCVLIELYYLWGSKELQLACFGGRFSAIIFGIFWISKV